MHASSVQESEASETTRMQDEAQREALKAGKSTGEEASELDKAADFGRLRTMKVQQAKVSLCWPLDYTLGAPCTLNYQ